MVREDSRICNGLIYLDFIYYESKIHSDKTRSFTLLKSDGSILKINFI